MSPNVVRALRIAATAVSLAVALYLLPVMVTAAVQPSCISCHASQDLVSTVSAPAHDDPSIDCVACHVEESFLGRTRFAHYQVWGMYLPFIDLAETSAAVVSDASCASCHDDLEGISQSRGLRIKHEFCAAQATCVSCHGTVAHGDEVAWPTTYHMDQCLTCHSARAAAASCETCHVGEVDRGRPTTGPWAITHGPNWETTHGMGDMGTCSACHEDSVCGKCHGIGVPHAGRFYEQHGVYAKTTGSQCADCHPDQTFCTDCHAIEMPHPLEFIIDHGRAVDAEGDADCQRCHSYDDCTLCHLKHVHPGGAVDLDPPVGVR